LERSSLRDPGAGVDELDQYLVGAVGFGPVRTVNRPRAFMASTALSINA